MPQLPARQPTASTILTRPLISFGREICGDLPAALRREWLVTNGLGGYASSSLAGINTRRYHGLLVAALTPPVGRTVLLGGLVEWATYDGARYPLSAHEYGDGTIDPHGERELQSFALEGALPIWIFACGDALVERRICMPHGANTTYVTYRLLRGRRPLALEITPLVTYRDFHTLSSGRGWQPDVELEAAGCVIRAFAGARPFRLLAAPARFVPGGAWWWDFLHRAETARGLDDRSDLYAPGRFTATLDTRTPLTLVCTVEPAFDPTDPTDPAALDGPRALAAERARQDHLLRMAQAERADPAIQQLTLAADQFLVARQPAPAPPPAAAPIPPAGRTVIAGYHWFNDWGRDTMIALPGLTLATGRPAEAADILRTFARYVRDGLLPNNFPDQSGALPGYNTADATLWYVLAIRAYHEATGDTALVDALLPTLRAITDAHLRGTRYHIGVDPADGLLHAGEPGVQLTWMDARVGDWVVTPRIGKPVEINALWYNALETLAAFLAARADPAAETYRGLAERAHASFRARFLSPTRGYLADVVDGPAGDDFTLRPNQIFAVSLPFALLDGAEAAAVLDAVSGVLLTTYGLRSLSPDDPAYHGDYGGDQLRRDGAYHQGPVWTWLMGAFADAHLRVHGDPAATLALLRPFAHHLTDAGLGSVSEILEGDPPHLPVGCIAQAWGVAEVLRVWRVLTDRR